MPKYRVTQDSFINNSYAKAGAVVELPDTHPDGKPYEVSDNLALIGTKRAKEVAEAIKNEELLEQAPREIVAPLEAEQTVETDKDEPLL